MRARGLTAPLSREGGPSYREAKGGDGSFIFHDAVVFPGSVLS